MADNLDRAQDSVVARKEGEAPLSKETETLLEGVVRPQSALSAASGPEPSEWVWLRCRR